LDTISGGTAGLLMSLGMIMVADCWLVHPPYIIDVMIIGMGFVGMVILNTVEWEVVVSSVEHVRRSVIGLMMICYGLMFIQVGYVIWNIVQNPQQQHSTWQQECKTQCCMGPGGYLGMLTLTAASVMRFTSAATSSGVWGGTDAFSNFGAFGTSSRSAAAAERPSPLKITSNTNIAVAISAVCLLVSALILQMFASVGRFGTTYAFLLQLPVTMIFPISIITNIRWNLTGSAVWHKWSVYVPVVMYSICLAWPFMLHHREYLDKTQLGLGAAAAYCMLFGLRGMQLLLQASVANSGGGGNVQFMML
jgi:uncharacterized membrane protein YidH (DUF202 family)